MLCGDRSKQDAGSSPDSGSGAMPALGGPAGALNTPTTQICKPRKLFSKRCYCVACLLSRL